jgi:uracil-DNA glycosylase
VAQSSILMENSWLEKLKEEFVQPYMTRLQNFLRKEKEAQEVIYPPEREIFNAFCHTSFEETRVVIIGQDPYHGHNQAHGLSFSVRNEVPQPPSLKNIFQELVNDVGITFPKTGCLLPWAKQGVLLLNATLTVRAGQPRSHYGQGWEEFTDKAVELLLEKKEPVVFLLWGKSAEEKCQKVFNRSQASHHLVLKAAHPSFYSVSGFWGCKHFSKTNEFLIKNKLAPINWQIV